MQDSSIFPLAFVDLETTGATATEDRITEIGIVEVTADGVREWNSLVNPGMPIPPFIQQLTGISNDMVAQAPTFEQVAQEVFERLEGRLFIAHNARFDHGFLKNAFRRAGIDFRPQVLCTVRLSRKLYPLHARHNLDSLIDRHRLDVSERHRALGDARLIWQFWNKLPLDHPAERIAEVVKQLTSRPALPSALDADAIKDLPTTAGVYIFYGDNALPLYVGKANNIRQRVLSHFSSDSASQKELELSQQLKSVKWTVCAGEIGALLLEAALIKQSSPLYNKQLRRSDAVCAYRAVVRAEGVQFRMVTPDDLFFGVDDDMFGPFTSPVKAKAALVHMATRHDLCLRILGVEKGRAKSRCFASQVKRCRGVCHGEETLAAHTQRVLDAMQEFRMQPWPWAGAVALLENGAWHVLHNWGYLGSTLQRSDAELLAKRRTGVFDRDVYVLLNRKTAAGILPRMVPLGVSGNQE